MRESLTEAGLLEIHRYLPPALLEQFDMERLDMDEFLWYVARARYVQELETSVVARAIAMAFSEEG